MQQYSVFHQTIGFGAERQTTVFLLVSKLYQDVHVMPVDPLWSAD